MICIKLIPPQKRNGPGLNPHTWSGLSSTVSNYKSVRRLLPLPFLSCFFASAYQWSYNILLLLLICIAPTPSPLFFPYIFVPAGLRPPTPTSSPPSSLPSVRKEENRVEVGDSTYMSVRTEALDGEQEPARKFARKFRLPAMVDVNGISAGYGDGVLTVRVPRAFVNRGFFIDLSDLTRGATEVQATARAA